MDRTDRRIHRALNSHWEYLNTCAVRLNPSVLIEPSDGYSTIKYVRTEGNASIFDTVPILLRVPERADAPSIDLFVVITGFLHISRTLFETDEQIRTLNFGTQAAYFRLKGKTLNHIYGAHFDFSQSELGHPVFHGQMKSFSEFSGVIKDRGWFEDFVLEDAVDGVLRTVRLPSAQMDVFSYFLQVVADHMLGAMSGEDEKLRFSEMLDRSKTIQGAGSQVARLQVAPAIHCYRAAHWYPPNP